MSSTTGAVARPATLGEFGTLLAPGHMAAFRMVCAHAIDDRGLIAVGGLGGSTAGVCWTGPAVFRTSCAVLAVCGIADAITSHPHTIGCTVGCSHCFGAENVPGRGAAGGHGGTQALFSRVVVCSRRGVGHTRGSVASTTIV